MQPKMISVIVPIYNKAPYIQKCLEDISNQTYRNLEIICINDGSTDDSGEIVKAFVKKDSRFQYVEQENQGVSAARNRGLELANGEYISFIDCDDGLECDMYAFLLDLIKKYNADIAHCGYKKIHLDGSVSKIGDQNNCLIQTREEALKCLIGGQFFTGSLWTKLFKSSLLENARFDNELKVNEDILMNFKLFDMAEHIVFDDATKYLYYERAEASSSRVPSEKKLLDSMKVFEYIFENCYEKSELKGVAARRLFYVLTNVYRYYVFYPQQDIQNKIRSQICQRITEIQPFCESVSFKYRLNYQAMRKIPQFYKFLYQIYNSVRKPNWDVSIY